MPQPGYQQPYMPQPGYQQPYMPQPGYDNQQPNPDQNNQFGGKLEPDYHGIKFRIYKK